MGKKDYTGNKDYTGKKHGMLTVIKATEKRNNQGSIMWVAQCDCGKLVECLPVRMSFSCGCKPANGRIDYSGMRLGNLTMISAIETPAIYGGKSRILWNAKCDCGNECVVVPSSKSSKSCYECGRKQAALKIRKYSNQNISAAARVYRDYKFVDFTFEEFYELSQKECFYCGVIKSNTHTYKNSKGVILSIFQYNGFDRVDSSLEHTRENMVICCRQCNIAKMDFTQQEFISMCHRVSKKHPQLRDADNLDYSI